MRYIRYTLSRYASMGKAPAQMRATGQVTKTHRFDNTSLSTKRLASQQRALCDA